MNLNDYVYVKLAPFAKEHWENKFVRELKLMLDKKVFTSLKEVISAFSADYLPNSQGYYKIQCYEVMRCFGHLMKMGSEPPILNMEMLTEAEWALRKHE